MGDISSISEAITGISHIAIRAQNLDVLLPFYTDTLGFRQMFRRVADGGATRLAYVRITDTQYLELLPNGVGDTVSPHETMGLNHLCLSVNDLSDLIRQLAKRGVGLTRPLRKGSDGNWQAGIDDPEGNLIELMELSPTGEQSVAIARLNAQA